MIKTKKALKQEIQEKNNTIMQLEDLIDYKNAVIKEKDYRIDALEKEVTELNNIVDNLLEKIKFVNIKQAREVKVEKNRSAKPRKQNTSKQELM